MQILNYQKEMEKTINKHQREGVTPTLLLHSCCGPCSSYVLEYLSQFFRITLYYYNPNIDPPSEYQARFQEQKRLVEAMETTYPIEFLGAEYHSAIFYEAVKGMEKDAEGGNRCTVCYELRLREAAIMAKEGGYDYFTTTLSISPKKDAVRLNQIGEALAEEYGVSYLYSDFKKRGGYLRSVELSKAYDLYRQDYCGCVFSRAAIKERET